MNKKTCNKINRVVIVDDHEIFRQGLKTLIKGFENLIVIGSLKDGKQLEDFLKKQVPDIIQMDINMPNLDGIAALKFLLSGDVSHFMAVLKAHYSYYCSFGKTFNKRKNLQLLIKKYSCTGIYRKSIVNDYFFKGKRKFSELNPELFGN